MFNRPDSHVFNEHGYLIDEQFRYLCVLASVMVSSHDSFPDNLVHMFSAVIDAVVPREPGTGKTDKCRVCGTKKLERLFFGC